MSSMPVIPEAAALAGEWRLEAATGEACELRLSASEAPLEAGSLAAPMLALEGACAWAPGLAGWRPVPLGLELTNAAGFAVFAFEQTAGGVYQSSASGVRLIRR